MPVVTFGQLWGMGGCPQCPLLLTKLFISLSTISGFIALQYKDTITISCFWYLRPNICILAEETNRGKIWPSFLIGNWAEKFHLGWVDLHHSPTILLYTLPFSRFSQRQSNFSHSAVTLFHLIFLTTFQKATFFKSLLLVPNIPLGVQPIDWH